MFRLMTLTALPVRVLFTVQGNYQQAELLFKRVIVILEAALGGDHPQVATGLGNLAMLLSVHVRAVRIMQHSLGAGLFILSWSAYGQGR